MLACSPPGAPARAVHVVAAAGSPSGWRRRSAGPRWLAATGFKAKPGAVPLPDGWRCPARRRPRRALGRGRCRRRCPPGDWRLDDPTGSCAPTPWAPWAGRSPPTASPLPPRRGGPAALVLPEGRCVVDAPCRIAEATWLARDLVNTPANDLGPAELAEAVAEVAARFGPSAG